MSRVASIANDPAYRAAAFALALALAAIVGALAFEHLWQLPPCPLCLEQRYAYYAGVPVLFVAMVLLGAEQRRSAGILLVLVGLAFLANAGLGAYHAGVEWKLWLGPDTCAQAPGALKPLGTASLESLASARVVRCDVAAWRFLGLSLAGWNVIVSMVVAIAAAQAAWAALLSRARA
jgi:disulfide bond formation protein DsbB